MKKLSIILFLLIVGIFAKAQTTPYTGLTGYAINQSIGSDSAAVNSKGLLTGRLVVYRFADTTAANLQRVKNYPFAVIATTSDNSLWTRNKYASAWMKGSGSIDITNIDFLTDSSLVICFSNGACDTIAMNNFTDVVVNILNNFIDSTSTNNFTFLNDSTVIICNGFGVCDTISLGNTNNFFFLNDSTIVTCDTPQVIQVGDDFVTQQLCDTISIPKQFLYKFQNGLQEISPGIVEFGAPTQGDNFSALKKHTYLWQDFYALNFESRVIMQPAFQLVNETNSAIGNSVQSILHADGVNNVVRMYQSYYVPNVINGDTSGLMGNKKGYATITNAHPNWYGITADDDVAKQVGIFYHVKDTGNTDAITIFGQQVPANYNYAQNPPYDSSFYSKRIAVFKTTGQTQLPQYTSGAFITETPTTIAGWDSEGNFVQVDTSGIGGHTTILNDTTIVICSFGTNLCDTIIVVAAITADNGLTASTSTNVQWGATAAGANSPLLHATFINTGGFLTTFTGSNTGYITAFTNSGSGNGITSTATGEAIRGTSTNSFGVVGLSTNSTGVAGLSLGNGAGGTFESRGTGIPLWVTSNVASGVVADNILKEVFEIQRLVDGGNGASGIGAYINWTIDDDAGQDNAARLDVKWVDATHASNKSQMDFKLVSASTYNTIMSAYATGVVGIGISSGYTGTRLEVVDNSLAGANMVSFTSTSTAATGGLQRMLNISLSGANATASQNTYGIYSVNSHTGTSPVNVAIYGETQNGIGSGAGVKGVANTERGVWGDAQSGTGVLGSATSGNGGSFSATNGIALAVSATSGSGAIIASDSGLPLYISTIPSSTNTIVEVERIVRLSSGTAANGIGAALNFYIEESSAGGVFSNQIQSSWVDVTNATRTSKLIFQGVSSGTTQDWLILGQSGYLKLRPMTVTEAGAIATAEGLIVFVSNTDATFTSVGIWIYQNGAWKAL